MVVIDNNSRILTESGAIPIYTFYNNGDNNTYYHYIGSPQVCSRSTAAKVKIPDKGKKYYKWTVYTNANPEGVIVHNMICTAVLWAYPEKGMTAIRVNEQTTDLYTDLITDVKVSEITGAPLSNIRDIQGFHIGTVINGFPVREPSGYVSEYDEDHERKREKRRREKREERKEKKKDLDQ